MPHGNAGRLLSTEIANYVLLPISIPVTFMVLFVLMRLAILEFKTINLYCFRFIPEV
jgi:hypothetical protein